MRFVLFTLLMALASPALAQTTKPAATTQPASDTLISVRTVQVSGDPVKSLENYFPHIASDLGMQLLGANVPEAGNQVLQSAQDGKFYTLRVTLDKTGWKPVAKEFIDTLIERAQQEMQQDYDNRRGREMDMRQAEVARIHSQRVQAEQEIEDLRTKLHQTTGRLDVTPKNLREAMTKLQDERQQLELDLRGKDARGDAIAKAIAELTAQAEAKNKGDEVLAELRQVVEAREKQLEMMKKNFASGLNTSVEVQQVAAQAAEARAKVAERKRDALAAAGGDALASLNRELRMLAIDRAEQEARFKLVSQRLDQIGGEVDTIDRYDQLLSSFPKLVERDDESQANFREIVARLDMAMRPALNVTLSRDFTTSDLYRPASNTKHSAHPATQQ
jgi:hypothetical protein